MTKAHRIIGWVNVLQLLFLLVGTTLPWAVIMSSTVANLFLGLFILSLLICTVWGTINAFRYWGGKHKLKTVEHLLLGASVVNGLLLLGAVGAFIYFGES